MKSIFTLIDRELKWVQTQAMKMEYELQDGDEVAATLRFRSSFGSFATAESADGCWTFKRVGFWQPRVTIRACGSEQDIAIFKNNTWSDGGTLEMADGRKYPASTNFWMTEYAIAAEGGAPLLKYRQIKGFLHMSAHVQILPEAASLAELPWLAALGWYLTIMMQNDSAAVVAVTATVAAAV